MKRITVLIADGHNILRKSLRALLQKYSDILVVGEAEDGKSAVKLARELEPAVVIMNPMLPKLNGIEATRQIIRSDPAVRVLCLSILNDRRAVFNALEVGASGVLTKNCTEEELVKAIRVVSEGGTYLGRMITPIVVRDFVEDRKASPVKDIKGLTPREREVIQLIAEGVTTRDIAERLYISVKTVETHRRNIKRKLNLDSTAALTKYAIRKGITGIEE